MKRMITAPLFPAIPLLMLAVAVSCGKSGGNVPTEADCKNTVEQLILDYNKDRLKLVSVEKTNGLSSEHDGIRYYTMEFQCEVEVTQNCLWFSGRVTEPISGSGYDIKTVANLEVFMKKGLRRKSSGAIRLEKTEKGWRVFGAYSAEQAKLFWNPQ